MAIFGYARVSRRDQVVENQRQEIERAGYQVEFWYADEGISGSSAAAQRPQFRLLLDRIRPSSTDWAAMLRMSARRSRIWPSARLPSSCSSSGGWT